MPDFFHVLFLIVVIDQANNSGIIGELKDQAGFVIGHKYGILHGFKGFLMFNGYLVKGNLN